MLAWGALARDEGWLVATVARPAVGARRTGTPVTTPSLPWHQIGSAKWTATADGGGDFVGHPAVRGGARGAGAAAGGRGTSLTDAGDLPAVVRRRVDETVVASQRSPLPGGGGVLLVARRIPGQPGREWTVVFDDDAHRSDPVAREAARQKLADLVAADQPD